MTRSPWWSHRLRNDLILWDSISFTAELVKDFRIDSSIDTNIRQYFLSINNDNQDSFCEQGTSCSILTFDFCLDTDDSPPAYCRQPVYSIHEIKIMTTHIKVLEDNDWICDHIGFWCSLLVLTAKYHQEGCKDINVNIWRL